MTEVLVTLTRPSAVALATLIAATLRDEPFDLATFEHDLVTAVVAIGCGWTRSFPDDSEMLDRGAALVAMLDQHQASWHAEPLELDDALKLAAVSSRRKKARTGVTSSPAVLLRAGRVGGRDPSATVAGSTANAAGAPRVRRGVGRTFATGWPLRLERVRARRFFFFGAAGGRS